MCGNIINSCSESMNVYSPHPNYAEQKPDDWWNAVTACSRALLEKTGIQSGQVAGIVFCSLAMSVTLVDDKGDLLLPYSMIWSDNRASEDATAIRKRVGGDWLSEKILGVRVTGHYLVAKYRWLMRNLPDLLKRTGAILELTAYLCLRATGERVCEWTCAASSGLFDLTKKTWSDVAFKVLGMDSIRSKFMRLVSPTDQVGKLTGDAAQQMGLLEGTPVFGGALDAMAATTGVGAASLGDGMLMLGTSGCFGVLTDKKIRGHMGMVTTQSCDPGKLEYIGTSNAVGACMGWAAQNLFGNMGGGDEAFRQIDLDIEKTNTGADGLMFAPWMMMSERAPYQNDYLRSGFLNLNVNHNREHLIRAVAEGVAFNFAVMAEAAEKKCGFNAPFIRTMGGGARSLPWMQIFANVMNKRIEVVSNPGMAGAVGASLLAATGLGEYPSVEEAAKKIKVEHCLEPVREKYEFYKERVENFKMIYPATIKLYQKWNSQAAE